MIAKRLCQAAVLALTMAVSTAAHAHAKLESSYPKANTVVEVASKEVRLQFNEPLEMAFSKVKLIDAKGATVEPVKLELAKEDPKAMVATMPSLASGAYRVQWTTVTRDGHKVKGEFPFQVK